MKNFPFSKFMVSTIFFFSKTWNLPKPSKFQSSYSNSLLIYKTEVMATIILTGPKTKKRVTLILLKSIPVHPLLWMNVMLVFSCMVFAELLSTGYKLKIQNDNICLRRVSNQRPLAFQVFPLSTRLSGLLTICSWNFYCTDLRYDTTRTLCGVQKDIYKSLLTYSFMIDTI